MPRSATKKTDTPNNDTPNTMRYYDILGVPKMVWAEELNKAYRETVENNAGDSKNLKEIVQAYKVLSDPKKRRIYDEHGEEGLNKEMGSGSRAKETDTAVRGKSKKRGRDINRPLTVSLEEMYMGIQKRVKHVRRVKCTMCLGKGSKPGLVIKCLQCKGTGMVRNPSQFCDDCDGTGREIVPSCECEKCQGKKFEVDKKIIVADVYKSTNHLHRITIEKQADEEPGTITRDLVFDIIQEPHSKFKRNGDHLFYEHTLSLTEALCGFRFLLTHLDGRNLLIKSSPHQTVQPHSYLEIINEGMPVYNDERRRGNLYLHLKVELPVQLTDEQRQILLTKFPPMISEWWTREEISEATIPIYGVMLDDEEIDIRRKEGAAR